MLVSLLPETSGFFNLVSQLSCSRAMQRVLHLQDHGNSDFPGYTRTILKFLYFRGHIILGHMGLSEIRN